MVATDNQYGLQHLYNGLTIFNISPRATINVTPTTFLAKMVDRKNTGKRQSHNVKWCFRYENKKRDLLRIGLIGDS